MNEYSEYDEFESEESTSEMDNDLDNAESNAESQEESSEGSEETTETSNEATEEIGETIAEVSVVNFPSEDMYTSVNDMTLTSILLCIVILILGITMVGGFRYDL